MAVYNHISDKVYSAGNGLTVNLHVYLNKTFNDRTTSFYNEYAYYSSQFHDEAITIKRDYTYNISFDINIDDKKESVTVRIQDMINLENAINNAAEWYGGKIKNLYVTNNGKLMLHNKQEPIIISNLSGDRYIKFEPSVYCKDDIYKPGLRVYINEVYTDILLEKFMGLLYIMSKIDIYNCAMTLVNSLQIPLGTNLTKIDNSYDIEANEMNRKTTAGRQISGKKKNFFDMV